MIRAFFTPDIPSGIRQDLLDAWAPFDLQSAGEIHRKGAFDLPGFIKLVGEAADWFPLKAAATVFLSQLAKEAATDVYKHKAEVALVLSKGACAPIRVVARSLLRARLDSGPPVPGVVLGLSIPNDFFGTSIDLVSYARARGRTKVRCCRSRSCSLSPSCVSTRRYRGGRMRLCSGTEWSIHLEVEVGARSGGSSSVRSLLGCPSRSPCRVACPSSPLPYLQL